jgi:hypothetical protein
MQMTADQLIAEFKDTVLDLHFARRTIAALEAENASLRAQLDPAEEHGHSHPHDEDGGEEHGS